MRVVEGKHVEWVEQEAVVLDPESGLLHYLNPTAALVYALILEHGFDDAMQELERTYADNPGMKEELPALLEEMVEQGLLEVER